MAGKAAYRKRRQNRMGMLLVTTVVVMMLIVVMVEGIELTKKRETYMAREEVLMQAIEAEQARTEEIKEYEKYTQTKKYVEEIAKNKLGLVYEGEIIFKDVNKQVSENIWDLLFFCVIIRDTSSYIDRDKVIWTSLRVRPGHAIRRRAGRSVITGWGGMS